MKTKGVLIAFLGGVAAGIMGVACRKKEAPATVQEVLRRTEQKRVDVTFLKEIERQEASERRYAEWERCYAQRRKEAVEAALSELHYRRRNFLP